MFHAGRPSATGVAVLAALTGLLGTGVAFVALGDRATPPPVRAAGPSRGDHSPARTAPSSGAPAHRADPAAPAGGGVADRIAGPVLPQSDPVSVSIPRLGVTSRLVHLGVDSAGAMEVPADPALAGWYTRGPTPGSLGPAVIAGHVTWNLAPAVFFRLGDLRSGDRVSVARRDGDVAVFSVSRVARFAKAHFPTQAVFGAIDHAGLRLITCGGQYDDAVHRYLDNVVVFASLVAVRSTR